ncbi:LysM peptidoglycan-binding domain-containing protein [Marimonas sp. MJW-29]|uniref:LysM peptidoglycan-binding domain-containing protein n=1 Tax=Sulfitobacter sediminis TaxID=3234186 RepID=A0ABV3RNL1_9RHOB
MAAKKRLHKVKKGETLESIARQYKYENIDIIWKDKRNTKLRKAWEAEAKSAKKGKQKLPPKLKPGDVLFLPMPKWVLKELEVVLLNMNLHRNSLLEAREDAKARISDLKKRNGYIQYYIKRIDDVVLKKVAEIKKYMKKAEDARDHADLIQSFATMHNTLAKEGLKKVVVKGGSKLEKKIEKQTLKQIEKSRSRLLKSKMISEGDQVTKSHLIGLGVLQDKADGLQSLAVDFGAKGTDADTGLGKALRFYDDATSYAHYMWVFTRGVSGGGWSWSSISEDAEKKVRELVKLAEGYKAEMNSAIKTHLSMISVLEKQLVSLKAQIAEVEKKSVELIDAMAS